MEWGNIPLELIEMPNWVMWRFFERNGKKTKVPFDVKTNQTAKTNDQTTWAGFTDCLNEMEKYDGIGFCFPLDGSLVGIDVDLKNDPNQKEIESINDVPLEFQEMIKGLDSFCEISPSKKGFHIFVKATIPNGFPNRIGNVEIYQRGRYFTVTGCVLLDRPIKSCQVEIEQMYQALNMMFEKKTVEKPIEKPVVKKELSNDVETLLKRAQNDSSFMDLWHGNFGGENQSSADLKLCLKLCFYMNGENIDSLFRQSGLMREKWDKIHVKGQTYGNATIATALQMWDGKHFGEEKEPVKKSFLTKEKIKKDALEIAPHLAGYFDQAFESFYGFDDPKENDFKPAFFEMGSKGLFYEDIWICKPFQIIGRTRNSISGTGWGKLIEFVDFDGKKQQWAMPMSELSGKEYLKILYDLGLEISTVDKARGLLSRYIQEYSPAKVFDCVDKTGWHGQTFVLPDISIGQSRVILENPLPHNPFTVAKESNDWIENVGKYCQNNSRLMFAASCAFAAPLIGLVGNDENGGFHFRGMSSEGKTVILRVASSIFGNPNDYIQRWRATAVGIEQTAAQFNDALLCLDEIGQVEPHTAGEIAYMLANGQGKLRGAKAGGLRKTDRWRLLFLSTGEISLAQHIASAGKTTKAGQELRLADIPSNANKNMGVFETTHEFENGAAFAEHLTLQCSKNHGQVGRDFIKKTQERGFDWIAKAIVKKRLEFDKFMPNDAAGQAIRVSRRFALVAAAGELATYFGLTGWKQGQAMEAAKICLNDWLKARGGAGQREIKQALDQVISFLEINGGSRFQDFDKPNAVIQNRAGFYRDTNDGREYFVFTSVFKDEICKGLDYKQISQWLIDAKWILATDGRSTKAVRLPVIGVTRCYHFKAGIEPLDDQDSPPEKNMVTVVTGYNTQNDQQNQDNSCNQSVTKIDNQVVTKQINGLSHPVISVTQATNNVTNGQEKVVTNFQSENNGLDDCNRVTVETTKKTILAKISEPDLEFAKMMIVTRLRQVKGHGLDWVDLSKKTSFSIDVIQHAAILLEQENIITAGDNGCALKKI